MTDLGCTIVLLAILIFAGFFIRYLHQRKAWQEETEREFQARRASEDQEVSLGRLAGLALQLRQRIPYMPVLPLSETTADAAAAALGLYFTRVTPIGEIAGTGLPVPEIPDKERRRHLWVTGKTGAGKTTFLEALIRQDLSAGRGLAVASPERDIFRDRLLPMVPDERIRDLVYFAPGDPRSPLSWSPFALEPGQDRFRAAEDLFEIVGRVVVGDALGPRSAPILQNALSALVGREGSTFADVPRLLRDESFRKRVVDECPDEYVRAFFEETYPRLPRGADLPITTRLDTFLRPPSIRKALARPRSDFSIRKILDEGKIFFLDLSGLSASNRSLVGELVFAKFSLELLRRETGAGKTSPFYLYTDEFQTFAGEAPDTWRDLLSRGRRYGLGLTLSNQFPGQLPTAVSDEILGNCNSLVAFSLGSKDARVVAKELLVRDGLREPPRPLDPAHLGNLPVGSAWGKLAGGDAFEIRTPPPAAVDEGRTESIIRRVWAPFDRPTEERRREPVQEKADETPVVEEEPVVAEESRPTVGPKPRPPSRPGRGGTEHKYLQELVSRWGREAGFSAEAEALLRAGGRVDVALRREDVSIACEIAVSSLPRDEVEHIRAALEDGFGQVVTVSTSGATLEKIKGLLDEEKGIDRERVRILSPEELLELLGGLSPPEEETVAGYRVAVSYRDVGDADRRRKAIAKTIAKSMEKASAD